MKRGSHLLLEIAGAAAGVYFLLPAASTDSKGFGFITPEKGGALFVRFGDRKTASKRRLKASSCSSTLSSRPKSPKAANVIKL